MLSRQEFCREDLDDNRIPTLQNPKKNKASPEQVRPRAYSDQIQQIKSLETKARASFEQVDSLPTLSEKPLERHDSMASLLPGMEAGDLLEYHVFGGNIYDTLMEPDPKGPV